MTDRPFYSDRIGRAKPRVSEIVSARAWAGLTGLIQERIDDGSLARDFPLHSCTDQETSAAITGTSEDKFHRRLESLVPDLIALDPELVPDTHIALDVVDFVAERIAEPNRTEHRYWSHTHYAFDRPDYEDEPNPGQAKFQRDVDLLFARNGIAFTVGDDMRVQRIGPPEARPLITEFRPKTGEPGLDALLEDAVARFLSRDPRDRQDAVEKLWDAFERLKTIEIRGSKKESADQLIARADAGSDAFRDMLTTEFFALKNIGNSFAIRHHETDAHPIPTDDAADYFFTRAAALIAVVLRHTGRMA